MISTLELSFAEVFPDVNFQCTAGIRRKRLCVCVGYLLPTQIHFPPFSVPVVTPDTQTVHHSGPQPPVQFLLEAQQIRAWKEQEVGVDGVLMTWPIPRSPWFWQWRVRQSFHTALSCLQPLIILPLPHPIRPRQWQFPAIVISGCLTISFGSVNNSARMPAKNTFIKCPELNPWVCHGFLARIMTKK